MIRQPAGDSSTRRPGTLDRPSPPDSSSLSGVVLPGVCRVRSPVGVGGAAKHAVVWPGFDGERGQGGPMGPARAARIGSPSHGDVHGECVLLSVISGRRGRQPHGSC